MEPLEDRRLLSLSILGVTSAHDDFRFVAGTGLPSVLNTYQAQISGGTPTKVDFLLGGQTIEDTDPAGGWTAQFNMSSLTSDTELTVQAYVGTSVVSTCTHNVNLLMLPGWFPRLGRHRGGWGPRSPQRRIGALATNST